MNSTKLPNEFSSKKDPNFKYPEKFVMPEDYDFDLSGKKHAFILKPYYIFY